MQLILPHTRFPGGRHNHHLTDHLGNIRVRFADLNLDDAISDDEVLSEHHYYPFGMEMKGAWNTGENAPGGRGG